MVRNYKSKNLIVKGSRLATDVTANIILLYLYGFPIKEVCEFFNISEPTGHRLIKKFQERLLSDRELLECCLNLQDSNDEVKAYFSSIIDKIGQDTPVFWSGIFNCLFVCGKKVAGNASLLHTYSRKLGPDDDEEFWAGLNDSRVYHFRQSWCESCNNPLRDNLDIHIFNLIVSTNIHRHYITKENIRLHFPTMLIRAMAAELSKLSKEASENGTSYKDMVKIMWEGGLVILCQRPL